MNVTGKPDDNDLISPWGYEQFRERYRAAYGYYPDHDPSNDYLLEPGETMHYRNGREAKNGDEIVQLNDKGQITDCGTLINAVPGNDYCNGIIANHRSKSFVSACLTDCLHVECVVPLLKEKGWDKRPTVK